MKLVYGDTIELMEFSSKEKELEDTLTHSAHTVEITEIYSH